MADAQESEKRMSPHEKSVQRIAKRLDTFQRIVEHTIYVTCVDLGLPPTVLTRYLDVFLSDLDEEQEHEQ